MKYHIRNTREGEKQMERKFYDPEYDRVVDESIPQKQYAWFIAQPWFHQTYEEFLAENFTAIDE